MSWTTDPLVRGVALGSGGGGFGSGNGNGCGGGGDLVLEQAMGEQLELRLWRVPDSTWQGSFAQPMHGFFLQQEIGPLICFPVLRPAFEHQP